MRLVCSRTEPEVSVAGKAELGRRLGDKVAQRTRTSSGWAGTPCFLFRSGNLLLTVVFIQKIYSEHRNDIQWFRFQKATGCYVEKSEKPKEEARLEARRAGRRLLQKPRWGMVVGTSVVVFSGWIGLDDGDLLKCWPQIENEWEESGNDSTIITYQVELWRKDTWPRCYYSPPCTAVGAPLLMLAQICSSLLLICWAFSKFFQVWSHDQTWCWTGRGSIGKKMPWRHRNHCCISTYRKHSWSWPKGKKSIKRK